MRFATTVPLLLLTSCVIYKWKTPPSDETAIPVLPQTATCTTQCGLVIDNLPSGECSALSSYEQDVVRAYQETSHDRDICPQLKGWRLILVDADNGVWKVGRHWVHGATVCDDSLTFLGQDPTTRRSALAHEIGHILDCRGDGPKPTAMHQHDGWRDRGYCEAIARSSDLDIPCEHDATPHSETQRAAH